MRYGYGYFEEDQLGKIGDLKIWKRIISFVRPVWNRVALAILLSLIITASELTLPYLVKMAIDRYIIKTTAAPLFRIHGLMNLAIFFFAIIAVAFVANFLQVWILEYAGQNIMHDMRQRLFEHLLHLDVPFFDRNPVGKLVTRLTNDVQNMHEMFTSVIITVFNDLVILAGIVSILFYMNTKLAFILALNLPLILLLTRFFSSYARGAFRQIRTSLARINSFVQEALSGIVIIQGFLRENDTLKRFADLNYKNYLKNMYQIKIFAVFVPLIEVLGSVSIAIIIWYGGREVLGSRVTIGVLAAFISYMRLFFRPIRELSQKYSIIQSALASAERIFELLDTKPRTEILSGTRKLERVEGKVEFKNVSFSYEPGKSVIENLSFKVNPGKSVAIVGATGAGKTTIVNLLERFYEPDEGQILLDNVNIKEFELRWLREQIGLVMQDVFIIPGSVRENILLDRKISEEKLREILEISRLDAVLKKQSMGIETVIGEGGIELSAGEKQLLALARVLVKDPGVLILDEATASVDTETELLITRAMEATLANRTSIIIAHRLATIRRADSIIVMERGKIAEVGSHEELLSKGGVYSGFHELQALVCAPSTDQRV